MSRSDREVFYCVTSPCGTRGGGGGSAFVPFSTAPSVFLPSPIGRNPRFGLPAVEPLATVAGVLESAAVAGADLVRSLREDPEEDPPPAAIPDIGGELPIAAPPPVRLPQGIPAQISQEEIASINEQLRVAEESERPIVRVTEQERDDFIRDRDAILARTGRNPDSLPPELNPILLLTGTGIEPDEPAQEEEPQELAPTIRIPLDPTRTGPPVLLGDLDTITGPVESGPFQDEFEGEPMADLSDIFGSIGDAFVRGISGSLDFDPRTPGIIPGVSSLPDLVGDAFAPNIPQVTPAPRSTPVQVNIDPVTGRVTQCKRRRRRRLLTKSDIADISTMAALLGKNSESFKVWLAKATR